MDDIDHLLTPMEQRFGKHKRKLVDELLRVEAELGIVQELLKRAADQETRAQLTAKIANLEREIDRLRRDLGVYVMLYVRSIFPQTAWSLWARLAQALAGMAP